MSRQKEVVQTIENHIFTLRGERVIFDSTLADLYGVETKVLLQAVKRNQDRFPIDFMFQLNKQEFQNLRSQTVTSNWGGRRYAPYAFTEQGVAMLSSVLRSSQAVQVNVEIMRAFVRLRQLLGSHKQLKTQIEALEKRYDKQFKVVFDAIHQLMLPPDSVKKHPIGFAPWVEEVPIKKATKKKPRKVITKQTKPKKPSTKKKGNS